MTAEEIAALALKLDHKSRASLAGRLLRSLDEEEANFSPEEWERAWAEEAERRLEELRTGKIKGIPGEEVFARARALLSS